MKIKIFSLFSLAILLLASCKKDYLERYPQDTLVDESYWSSETNVRTFAWAFYPAYFDGYGSGYTWGKFFSGQPLNDDFAPSSPSQFTQNVPASGGGWSFAWVRKANLFINRIQRVPMNEEAIKHWTGIARFFRALEYNDLVKAFGDVPWYGKEMTETDPDLYKPRDSRVLVMDSVLADFKYAAENVRVIDGNDGLTVNRNVVLALMSRVFLYHGTYFKYHTINATKATEYLQAAQWAANEVINSNKYSIGDNFRTVFNSLDLAGKKEIILYRSYQSGLLTHSLHSYVNGEAQSGTSKDAIDAFLAKDGLPISLSPLYKGDKTFANVMTDRDQRLIETIVPELRLSGYAKNYSTSGYSTRKFFNDALKDLPEGSSNLNTTDAPVIRYGEVLLNYAEATVELGALSQADLDKSINKLRSRPGIAMPALQVIGDQPAVNGVTYDDPDKDPTVPSLIWEIRRERRIELLFEGFRLDDLRRWKKLEYTTTTNSDINRGAWIKKADYPNLKDVKIENDAAEGYIIPAWKPETQRIFSDPKVYLSPLPLDQIKLYSDIGATLSQNPGWQ
ncbi:RagB/SusD family nutrient uptake outer membrane protein [Terrimonas pollutisoli]|uniref:RagB/SusD family nutrient uptake outer membrane protein n=1 Tax=Terrimonas pollutisoli TaxID=3034147 RepID=UPI0023EDB531|nr:RagB/SusD family nutrient uptake outer membrane protein [Terrimonas sp. H1YJ31]